MDTVTVVCFLMKTKFDFLVHACGQTTKSVSSSLPLKQLIIVSDSSLSFAGFESIMPINADELLENITYIVITTHLNVLRLIFTLTSRFSSCLGGTFKHVAFVDSCDL